jgi:hypothetical protein
MRWLGIVDDGEGIEIAVFGGRRHGGVAREIRDARRQGCHPRVRRPRPVLQKGKILSERPSSDVTSPWAQKAR